MDSIDVLGAEEMAIKIRSLVSQVLRPVDILTSR